MTGMARGYRIVLTGGPCGGKTTALNRLRDRFQSLGWRVFTVPETATLMSAGGVQLGNIPPGGVIRRQSNFLSVHLALEDSFFDIAAETGEPAVVFCDRGAMDYSVYMPDAAWQALLDERGWTPISLCQRYDAAIHLVTAAIGAESAYTTANNAARSETLEQARKRDESTRRAWIGHPHLHVIDNSTGFDDKVRRVIEVVSHRIGVPAPARLLRKFLVRPCATLPVHSVEIEIELTCLRTSDGSESRLRRRGQGKSFSYALTIKSPATEGGNVRETPLTGREYFAMLSQADPARRPVKKRRRCFLYDNHYFEFDDYREPVADLYLLQVELNADAQPQMPPFVEIEREVTGETRFTTATIAARSGDERG